MSIHSLTAAAAMLGGILSAAAAAPESRPPDPSDPSTWGSPPPPLVVIEAPATGFGQAAARARDRSVVTQRMARVKGEMLAAIEPDGRGGKIAKVVRPDGSVEMRPLRVLYTARVKPPAPAKPGIPRAAENGAAAAAGAVAGAAAAIAIKKGLRS